jgi:hypothetical protein
MEEMPTVAVVPVIEEWSSGLPPAVYAALALLAGGAGLSALVVGRRNFAQTTLIPAWWWTVTALVGWTGVELFAGLWQSSPEWLAPLRLSAVALSFCPILAVLGAKRPQHAAWSFVVASFWGIVALPAAETFFLQRGQRLEIGDARSWFLWVLIAAGLINNVPTKRWLASILLAAGQVLALSEYLPVVSRTLFAHQHLVGLWLASAAIVVVRLTRTGPAGQSYDRLWLDFRDMFGMLWALRLQERVNAVAESHKWPVWLAWSGLRDKETGNPMGALDPTIERTLRTTLRGLLRRFVSGRWIAERLGHDID